MLVKPVKKMKVITFGGSSLADAKQILKVCKIILSDDERRLVVVSAPGKRYKEDKKVTDMLISLAEASYNHEDATTILDEIVERYASISRNLGLDNTIVNLIRDDLVSRINTKTESYNKFVDLLKAAGEDNNAKLIAC